MYDRLIKHYKFVNLNLRKYDKWMVLLKHAQMIEDAIHDKSLLIHLHNFGQSILTKNIDCEYYFYLQKNHPEIYYNSLNHQKEMYKQLVDDNYNKLVIPDKFLITGDKYDDGIIPHTGYRIGYYANQISKYTSKSKKIYLEIGGGFGLLAYYLTKQNHNICYMIVDIPNTSILSGYFLINLNLKVCLYGEYDKLNEELYSKYDVVIIPPMS